MQDDLIEINDKGHKDIWPFFFTSQVLEKEDPLLKPHLTHLRILDGYVYGTNGATIRRAKLREHYENGIYRVLRRTKKWIILYITTLNEYPPAQELFDLNGIGGPLQQVEISETYWHGHAEITAALKGEHAFNADFLKNVNGVFELYTRDNGQVILDNEDYGLVIMPMQRQKPLPFNDGEAS